MAITIPTASQNDIISSLRSSGLTNAANATFFGNGSLSGTVDATNLSYKPITAVQLNPNDFSNLNPSQLAAIQRQSNIQTDNYNAQQNKVLNQFNQLRQQRLIQNEDALATSQQLFSVVGGINPLQSGRNAGALTGMQVGTKNDLINLFNQASDQVNQINIGANTANLQALQMGVNTDLQLEQQNFNQSLQLSDRLGTFVDKSGNLSTVAGKQNVKTLSGLQLGLSEKQANSSIDLNQRNQQLKEADYLNQLTQGDTTYGPDGKQLYTDINGNPTNKVENAQKDSNGNPLNYKNTTQVISDYKNIALLEEIKKVMASGGTAAALNLLSGYGSKSGTSGAGGTSTGGGKTTNALNGVVTDKNGNVTGFNSDGIDLFATGVSGNLLQSGIDKSGSAGQTSIADIIKGKLTRLQSDSSNVEFNRFFYENNNNPDQVNALTYAIRSQNETGQNGFKFYGIRDPKAVTVKDPKTNKNVNLYEYVKNSGDKTITDQDIATVLSTAAKSDNARVVEYTNANDIADFLDNETKYNDVRGGNGFARNTVIGMMYQQNAQGATSILGKTENDRKLAASNANKYANDLNQWSEAYAKGEINFNSSDSEKKVNAWVGNNNDRLRIKNEFYKSKDSQPSPQANEVNSLFSRLGEYYNTTLNQFGDVNKANEFFKLTTGYALSDSENGKYNGGIADSILSYNKNMIQGAKRERQDQLDANKPQTKPAEPSFLDKIGNGFKWAFNGFK